MSQLLKKFALLTACAVLALCFATRPAHAQSVAMNGTGDHLLFAYWSTANYTNTNVNVHSPLGVRDSGETMNVVRVKIRDTMGESVADFNICLKPGDSWTATLSMDGLMVMDAGECDANVAPPTGGGGRSGGGMTMAPMMGEMMSLSADAGYLEAWLNPDGTLVDNSAPCRGDVNGDGTINDTDEPRTCVDNTNKSGDDTDLLPDDATPRFISGSAMLVSPMSGFSSSYNAVALVGCGNTATVQATPDVNIAAFAPHVAASRDDSNGCWAITPTDSNTVAPGSGGGEPIRRALQGVAIDGALDANEIGDTMATKDVLTGRWTAISDENVMSHTKVVVTLPVNHLSYKGRDGSGNPAGQAPVAVGTVEGTDPLTLFAFDDAGQIALDSREVMLDMNVNTCMFGMMDMDMGDEGMDDGMDMGDGMGMVSCNGMEVGDLGGAMSGEFRIFNSAVSNVRADGAYDDGTTNGGFTTGAEGTGLGTADVATTTDVNEGGQVAAESLGAIGLIFSYFMGTDGMQYDQATPLQSIDISTTAGEAMF